MPSSTAWLQRARAVAARVLVVLAGLVALAQAPAIAAEPASHAANAPVRFGILPFGGAAESRGDWEPLLAELSQTLGRPVTLLSVTSYEALEQAIRRDQVDMAFLSGKMALDAVSQRRMKVVAQVTRHDGLPGYRSLLLARRDGPVTDLETVLSNPEKWRIARSETRSVSGFIVPQLQLFLPRHIAMDTRFAGEIVGNHQATALAVANGEVDVATNNSADMERFKTQFPAEFDRLKVLWSSDLIPHAQIVVRRDYPPALQEKVRAFLVGYGRGKGARADAQRVVLKSLHDFAGFLAAGNESLVPAARLAYQLARQSALSGQWVDEASRQARLRRLDNQYADQMAALRDQAD